MKLAVTTLAALAFGLSLCAPVHAQATAELDIPDVSETEATAAKAEDARVAAACAPG